MCSWPAEARALAQPQEEQQKPVKSKRENTALFNYVVQTEVGARENLRLAMVNSAVGDTCVTVTLGTSGSHPPKVHGASANAREGHGISWWKTQWKLQ